jgi:hypothetical protein
MKTSTNELEMQLNAVLGFVLWSKSILSQQTVESSEFTEQLIHTLQIYGWELNRQIDGVPGTQDWFCLVATTSILAIMLQDELLELNPALEAYRPSDEPQTIQEMISRLLSDAVTLFEASQKEMAEYLEKPVIPCVPQEFMQRVQAGQATA